MVDDPLNFKGTFRLSLLVMVKVFLCVPWRCMVGVEV